MYKQAKLILLLSTLATVFLLALFVTPTKAFAIDYYVDPTGDNTNTGTDSANAWADFTNVNALTLQPGDRVLLVRGGSWDQTLQIDGKGTSESPIFVEPYGTGPRPRICGSASMNTGTDFIAFRAMRVNNASYLRINSLEVCNGGAGIVFYYSDTGNQSVYLDDIVAHDFYGISQGTGWANGSHQYYCNAEDASYFPKDNWSTYTAPDRVGFSYGIGITGDQMNPTDRAVTDFRITNSEIYKTGAGVAVDWLDGDGIYTNTVGEFVVDNVNLHDNDIPSVSLASIFLKDCTDCQVINTIINRGTCTAPFGTSAIFLGGQENLLIDNVTISNSPWDPSTGDSMAIDFEGNNSNVVVRNSWFENNAGGAIQFYNNGGPATNFDIYNNVFNQNSIGEAQDWGGNGSAEIDASNWPDGPGHTGTIRDNWYTTWCGTNIFSEPVCTAFFREDTGNSITLSNNNSGFPSGTPTPSPLPTASPTPLPTPTPGPTLPPTPTPLPSPTFTPTPTPSGSLAITNHTAETTVPSYERLDIQFDIENSVATNNQWPCDLVQTNPTTGTGALPTEIGITVDAVLTHTDSGTTVRQPAFWYVPHQYEDIGEDWMYPTGHGYWLVRFAPQMQGNWTYYIEAQEGVGCSTTARFPTSGDLSFTVTSPPTGNRGFINVSQTDPRYFEFSDGTAFLGQGHGTGLDRGVIDANAIFPTLGSTQANFTRVWYDQSLVWSRGIHGWDSWRNADGLRSSEQTFGHGDLALRLAGNNSFIFQTSDGNQIDTTSFAENETYKIRMRARLEDVTPSGSGSGPSGLVAKLHCCNGFDHDNTQIYLTPTGFTGSSDWQVYEATFTNTMGQVNSTWNSNLTIGLQNVTAGSVAFIDEIYIGEDLGTSESATLNDLTPGLGPNIVFKGKVNYHQYYDQHASFKWDQILEVAKTNDVYLKLVMSDNRDYIVTCLNPTTGLYDSNDCDDSYFFNSGNSKNRRLQEYFWRYLIARWGYSTNIHSWELTNEGPPFDGAHEDNSNHLGNFFSANDPNQHMASTSYWHSFTADYFNSADRGVDYADFHAYNSTGWINDTNHERDAAAYHIDYSLDVRSQLTSQIPIVRGEGGIDNVGGAQEELTALTNDTNGVWLHNMTWAFLDPGAVYELYWWPENIWANGSHSQYTGLQNFIANVPISNGLFQDAQPQITGSSLRAVGQSNSNGQDADQSVVWIQNTNHTWRNVVDGVSIGSMSGSVTLPNFEANTTFPLELWEYNTAGVLSQSNSTINSDGSGNIVVDLSTLTSTTTDVAVKIGDFTPVSATPTPIPLTATPSPPLTPTPTPVVTTRDVNNDSEVSGLDIQEIANNWLGTSGPADVLGDSKINAIDVGYVYRDLPTPTNTPSPPPQTPTPTLPSQTYRRSIDLNGTWNFTPLDGGVSTNVQTTIRVPDAWDADPGFYDATSATYERTINIPIEWQGSDVILELYEANWHVDLDVNGTSFTRVSEGIGIPTNIDITSAVNFGSDNTIQITVTEAGLAYAGSRPAGTFRWGQNLGLTGDVTLRSYPQTRLSDVFVQTSFRNDEITVDYEVLNNAGGTRNLTLEPRVTELDGTEVITLPTQNISVSTTETATSQATWNNPTLWMPHNPHLYYLETTVRESGTVIDIQTTRFGFRETWTQGTDIILNDIPVTLFMDSNDLFQHAFMNYYYTLWYDRETTEATVAKLLESRNSIRVHQAPPVRPHVMDVFDEQGVMVIAESAMYGGSFNQAGPPNITTYTDNAVAWIPKWIKRERNHPSIIIWSAENEMGPGWLTQDETQLQRMGDTIRALDQTRPVTYEADEICCGSDFNSHHYDNLSPNGDWPTDNDVYAQAQLNWNPSYPNQQNEYDFMGWHGNGIFSNTSGTNTTNLTSMQGTRMRGGLMTRGYRYQGWANFAPHTFIWQWADMYQPNNRVEDLFVERSFLPVAAFDIEYDRLGENPPIQTIPADSSSFTRNIVVYNQETNGSDQVRLIVNAYQNGSNTPFFTYSNDHTISLGGQIDLPVTIQNLPSGSNWIQLQISTEKDGQQRFSGEHKDFWLQGTDTTPPPAPTNLTANLSGEDRGVLDNQMVYLTWDVPSPRGDIKGWNIYRSTNPNPTTLEDSVMIWAESEKFDDHNEYFDITPTADTYYYRITSVDLNDNESTYSNEVTATTVNMQNIVRDPGFEMESRIYKDVNNATSPTRSWGNTWVLPPILGGPAIAPHGGKYVAMIGGDGARAENAFLDKYILQQQVTGGSGQYHLGAYFKLDKIWRSGIVVDPNNWIREGFRIAAVAGNGEFWNERYLDEVVDPATFESWENDNQWHYVYGTTSTVASTFNVMALTMGEGEEPTEPLLDLYVDDIVLTRTNTIPPVALTTQSKVTGTTGTPILLDASISFEFDTNGNAQTPNTGLVYEWEFGNGQTSSQANPQATYNSTGEYIARVTITDQKGLRSSAQVFVTVQ